MRFFLLIIVVVTLSSGLYSDKYYEAPFNLYRISTLSMGDANVANSKGLDSFQYNPAGLLDGNVVEFITFNYSIVANLFQLSEDMVDLYNEEKGVDYKALNLAQIMFFSSNPDKAIEVFMEQIDTPYKNQRYPNGFGVTPLLSSGFVKNGFGLGIAVGLDAKAYGNNVSSGEFHSVLTNSLLLGYSLPVTIKMITLNIGGAVRPTYKVRGIAPISSVLSYMAEEKSEDDFFNDVNYLTGVGIGFDAGVKFRYMDLVAGLSLTDIGGTSYSYSTNNYSDLSKGDLIGSTEVKDIYLTPMGFNIGVAYNPDLKSVSKYFSPSLSIDYKVDLAKDNEFENFERGSDFLSNMSIGCDIKLLSFFSLRAGLNQGYMTFGMGTKLLALEVNAGIYSWELGREPGDRQQMGAGIEIAIRK